jgi:hypothetical protein
LRRVTHDRAARRLATRPAARSALAPGERAR